MLFLVPAASTWPLMAALLLWSALTSYVFIKAPTRYYLRWSLIPVGFLAAVFMSLFVFVSWGRATPATLPSEFEFLGYNVVLKGIKKSALEVWTGGNRTRLYVIPYSKEAEDAMKDAAKKKQQAAGTGGTVIMKNKQKRDHGDPADKQQKGNSQSGTGTDKNDGYESNIMLPEEVNPKETSPNRDGPTLLDDLNSAPKGKR